MRFVLSVFLRGLVAVLPLALTGYLAYAAVVGCETLLRNLVLLFVPAERYVPGMGFATSVLLLLLAGLGMYSFVVRAAYRALTGVVERIPVVKSVYGMITDVMRLFGSSENKPFRRVVLVAVRDGVEQLGFLTKDGFEDHPDVGADKVAVYLPMSYQIGGFTMIVPKDRVRDVAMTPEEALRFCVTAGVTKTARP
jgi:uncharacterized membrane protein